MRATTDPRPVLNHYEIAKLARQIWQAEGCQAGRDEEYWLEVEQQLKATKHLLLAEHAATRAAPPPVNGHGKPPAVGHGQLPAAMTSKARKGSGRTPLARFI